MNYSPSAERLGPLYRALVAHLAAKGLVLDTTPGAQLSIPVKGGFDLVDTLLLELAEQKRVRHE
jgi:hypothetical protein